MTHSTALKARASIFCLTSDVVAVNISQSYESLAGMKSLREEVGRLSRGCCICAAKKFANALANSSSGIFLSFSRIDLQYAASALLLASNAMSMKPGASRRVAFLKPCFIATSGCSISNCSR